MILPAGDDRLREHFLAACQLDGDARARYLDAAPLSESDRGVLEELLRSDVAVGDTTGNWLSPTLSDPPTPPAYPDRIGPYRLGEKLGEGGMGIVFRAEQSAPIARTVALKVLKRGFDLAPVVARFEAERRTLAHLDHPGITKILDAGVCESGEPYFVMEHVEGREITTYCDRHRLGLRARIELFLEVCAAVQHAHTKGIIHRDLKPSNILVTEQDGVARPKVIDFGIAKGTGAAIADHTLTIAGAVLGTPSAMSPEQVRGSGDLDTRTDVYSLGVVLFELLTGSLPFPLRSDTPEGISELTRSIREDAPPRPSSVVGAPPVPDSIDIAARERRLRGDLDWIILRALEKDPSRRYDSPARLADDLRRHLRDEPIEAGPPSTRVVVRKFIRRHRSGTALAIAAFAAALTGIAAGIGGPVIAATTVLVVIVSALIASNALLRRARFAREAESRQRALAEDRRTAAQESERRVAHHLDEVLRLSDLHRLDDLEARAARLWPATPDRVSDYETWLSEADALIARLPEHRRFLDELRAQGDILEPVGAEETIEQAWDLPTAELQWWHDCVATLVGKLRRFDDPDRSRGVRACIAFRLERAQTLSERTLTGEAARVAWNDARRAIERSARYDGLSITPQLGLLPLGENPASGLWEFWAVETGARPEPADPIEEGRSPLGAGRWRFTEETGLVFALVPALAGRIGAQSTDADAPHFDPEAEENEAPVESVTLDPFLIATTPITQGQWLRWTGHNPSVYGPDRQYGDKQHDLRHPVEHVDADECTATLARLGLVIPTEAQWELAARAGTTTPWWSGEGKGSLAGAANIADRFARENGGPPSWSYEDWLDDGYATHSPVGHYRANPFGLHDLHGNVAEWCRDAYTVPGEAPIAAGDGERIGSGSDRRVTRGGAFLHSAPHCRVSRRILVSRDYRASSVGVRAVRRLEKETSEGERP